jgi:nucleotide-binding universal stress UspA family protein
MFGTNLLAVDGSPHADRAAELVRRLAGDGGDEVVLLHITEVMPMRGGVSVELHQDRDGMAAAKRQGSELERAGVPVKVDLVRTPGRAGGADHRGDRQGLPGGCDRDGLPWPR